jgi:polar amino acid transport system substrate-binding protein
MVAGELSLVIAVDPTKPPMEFVDEQGRITGFEIDFLKTVAQEAGFRPVLKTVSWDKIFAGLAAGEYDAVCASVSITEDRRKKFSFTVPYINISQAVVVRQPSNIKSAKQLEGRKIGVKAGTTSLQAGEKIKDVQITAFPDIAQAMQALHERTVDAVICDGPVAAYYMAGKGEKSLRIAALLQSDQQEQYAMLAHKDDKNTIAVLNRGIQLVQQNLMDIELQKKWFAELFNIK